MAITAQQFQSAMQCQTSAVEVWLGPFIVAMARAEVNTPLRMAHFLSQISHESGGLRWLREMSPKGTDPAKYFEMKYGVGTRVGKMLGNTLPDDGGKYYGRGPIQLTGKSNYMACQAWMAEDLLGHPEIVEQPDKGALVAAWFWSIAHKLNPLADADNCPGITKVINGGTNGLQDRQDRLAVAKKALLMTA